jgi:P-type Cu+ transporter
VKPVSGFEEDQVLRWAATIERASEHPLAAAILAGAAERGIQLDSADDFQSVTGQGITARINGIKISLGNQKLMASSGADVTAVLQDAEARRGDGQTVMYLSADGKLAGLIGVADPIKSSAKEAIQELRRDGIRVVMLTGDSKSTARAVAAQLGIEEVIADVLPQDKQAKVQELQRAGRFVAMAGDGVNDAPALAQAQVGIAMGTGTDIAMKSAGVTLVKGDLRGIARARLLSRATISNIRQNLFFAFVYNAVGVPVAAGVLYPLFGLLLSPMIAAAAMSFSSVSVVANALRLRRVNLRAQG